MGKVKTKPEYPPPMTFEQIWTILQETARRQEETARRQEESTKKAAEWREEINKTIDDITRRQKENAKMISGLGGRYGEMVEYMVKPNLVAKFRELGFVFTKVYPETEIKDEKHNILAEVDLTLENGDKVMIVEVKSKPTITDIKDHIKRMDTVRLHADLHDDKRKYLGAVAGMVISDRVREFILTSGFYVIEPSGETFTITPPRGKPKEW